MKIKTINSIISKKVNELLDSIEDVNLRNMMRKNIIVTGGCITSLLLKEKVNDYDIYFRDIKTTFEVAKYYVKKMGIEADVQICTFDSKDGWQPIDESEYETALNYIPEKGSDVEYRVRIFIQSVGVQDEREEQYDEELNNDQDIIDEELDEDTKTKHKKEYKPVFITDNAITLSDKIQIVIRFYGEPDIIHANYDYIHVTNYYDSNISRTITNTKALEAILAKELIYQGSRYPLASLFRMRKFIQRGWTINVGQIMKMVFQLQKIDLSNPYILADQATGVDVHYLSKMIQQVQKKHESGEEFEVIGYANTIIESIFG